MPFFTLLAVSNMRSLTNNVGAELGVQGNFFTTLGTLISILVSLAGVILLVFIVVGGFYWMTAGGNTDQVAKAKRIIINSAIGILIILMSWAIATFVYDALVARLS